MREINKSNILFIITSFFFFYYELSLFSSALRATVTYCWLPLTLRRSFPSTELLSVEISLDSDSQRTEGKQNGGAWCTGDVTSKRLYTRRVPPRSEQTHLRSSVDASSLACALQQRTTPPPWWACVDPWHPSRAASPWRASSPASAWSISVQRTVLPSLPPRGRQRNVAMQPLDRHWENQKKKQTNTKQKKILFGANALCHGPQWNSLYLYALSTISTYSTSAKWLLNWDARTAAELPEDLRQFHRLSCHDTWPQTLKVIYLSRSLGLTVRLFCTLVR